MSIVAKMSGNLTQYGASLKRIWMSTFVQIEASVYRDDCNRLERAYRIPDPWNLGSQREQCRFQAVNEFIRQHCGRINSILEIGSGEGHHTQHLTCLARQIVGIEVSLKAITRSRQRCPSVRFIQCQFPRLPYGLEWFRSRYDLVLASEVLYYIRDIDKSVEVMSLHGKFCLVSCYEREIDRIEKHIRAVPDLHSQDLLLEGLRYRIFLWQPKHDS